MNATMSMGTLIGELERERATLERELTEIDLLMRQAASEAERHEARRAQAAERLATLERDANQDPAALREARDQLLAQTRRQILMQSQIEVLQGKQRALQRFYDRIAQMMPVLSQADGGAATSAASASMVGEAEVGSAPGRAGGGSSREIMAAQEQMRREIARQMHDGPAQSIANIALQAQVVQRLFARDPRQAESELRELVAMVQGALEQTKTFIFDVRPMVLDDLGLVPTLRRAAAERGRRSGQAVVFESVGADTRLTTEIESTLFRIVDDAVQGMLDARPAELAVRLDWFESGIKATVRGRASGAPTEAAEAARAAVAAARRDKQMPAALASMIHEQESTAAHGLSDKVWAEIRERAEPVGIGVSLSNDGWLLEASISRGR
jgi:two-component system, NarL family, sensor histidine kinase DegS